MATDSDRLIRERELVGRYCTSRDLGAEDLEARNELLLMHMPLVRWAAKQIHAANQKTTELAELVNVGCIGMIEGLRRFRPGLGYRISTYCAFWIRNAIHLHVRQTRWSSHVEEADYKLLMKLHKGLSRLDGGFNGYIDVSALARLSKVSEEDCHQLLGTMKAFRSVETPISRNGKFTLKETLEQRRTGRTTRFMRAHEQAEEAIREALQELPEAERLALTAQFLEGQGYYFLQNQFTKVEASVRDKGLRKLKKVRKIKRAYEVLKSVEEG